ncbi:hypothetical protein ILUMI_10262 [Ignelater luminosus]|uniref:Uncharacterized protein n=1 Tax=Ignelater luminosus TaxID=2038154 RepID=A0A8K0CYG2_IGNLU|nr:hypothetical protein ILUMI_10262 [Ignelater luminosus]
MVWQAVAEDGDVSESCFHTGTINVPVCLKECISKRLILFCALHYALVVTSALTVPRTDFVPKAQNPPDLPQCRPIERYWVLCKPEYEKYGLQTNFLGSFKRLWFRAFLKVLESSRNALFQNHENVPIWTEEIAQMPKKVIIPATKYTSVSLANQYVSPGAQLQSKHSENDTYNTQPHIF